MAKEKRSMQARKCKLSQSMGRTLASMANDKILHNCKQPSVQFYHWKLTRNECRTGLKDREGLMAIIRFCNLIAEEEVKPSSLKALMFSAVTCVSATASPTALWKQ